MPSLPSLSTLLLTLFCLVAPARALAQTGGEARELALEALRLEFRRDGVATTPDDLVKRFAAACDRGYTPACRRSTWLDPTGTPMPKHVLEVFEPSCEAGDPVACLVEGWSLDLIAQTERNPEDRDRTWRRAARLFRADCDNGFLLACNDYASFLYENKGVVSDPRPALARWRTACDGGESASCTRLARLNFTGGPGVPVNVAQATRYATTACDGGYPDGCVALGEIADKNWDAEKLDTFYGGLCEQGHRDSCWRLSRIYFDGIHPEPAPGRLQGLFVRACDLGHARSCFEAGRWVEDHDSDPSGAAPLFGRACELGDAAGCSAQVDLILSGKVVGTVRDAAQAFDVACEARQSIAACTALAYALIEGVDVPRDAERGRSLLQRACVDERSDPQACAVLGRCFEEGLGGDRDRTEASKFLRWACTAGNVDSCMRRGDLLTSDVGVRRDDHEALNMYQRACEGGMAPGCYRAGSILDIATYVTRDVPRAADFYSKACDLGQPSGCYGLGQLREQGVGSAPDMAGAREAYQRAIDAGSLDAKRALARLQWNGYGGKKQRGAAKALCREACQSGDAVACRGPEAL